ncbi:MAG: HIT family protein [Chloroflexota bacterium]|nr:MAG: diadenosine tetraphosphate hydrolase [Chloroflexota bacterium]
MYSHAPPGYDCPFCRIARDDFGPILTRPEDVVLRRPEVTAFISSHWWPRNPGHVLVIPNAHYENLYVLPDAAGAAIHAAARDVALAMKRAYGCAGISTRQHNEPAGQQEVWHYHLHVFPRYPGDALYTSERRATAPEERAPYAERLRAAL